MQQFGEPYTKELRVHMLVVKTQNSHANMTCQTWVQYMN